jgi:hypothetical protein
MKLKAGHIYFTNKSTLIIDVKGSIDIFYTDIFIDSVDSIIIM